MALTHKFNPAEKAQRTADKAAAAANMENLKKNANAMGTPQIKAALETLAASVKVLLAGV